MIENDKIKCDWCEEEIQFLTVDETEEDDIPGHGWADARTAALHLCYTCHDQYFKEKYCDGECETKPCTRGRDCWVNDSSVVPYETYLAERVTGQPVFERFNPRQATRGSGPAARRTEKYHQITLF